MISVFKNTIQEIGEVFVFLKRAIMKLIQLLYLMKFNRLNKTRYLQM